MQQPGQQQQQQPRQKQEQHQPQQHEEQQRPVQLQLAVGCWLDVAFGFMAVIASTAAIIEGWQNAPSAGLVLHAYGAVVAILASCLVLLSALCWQRHIQCSGSLRTWQRLLTLLILAACVHVNSHWACCKLYTAMLRHLLWIQLGCVLAHFSAAPYWVGVVLCWLAATASAIISLQIRLGQPLSCVSSPLQGFLSSSLWNSNLTAPQLTVALCSSLTLLGEVLLPGLLLSYLWACGASTARQAAALLAAEAAQAHGQHVFKDRNAAVVQQGEEHQAHHLDSSATPTSSKRKRGKAKAAQHLLDSQPSSSIALSASASDAATRQTAPASPPHPPQLVAMPDGSGAATALAQAPGLLYGSPVQHWLAAFKLTAPTDAGETPPNASQAQLCI